ncbi:hypothetical protein JW851_03105 [Candidatus Woesearchaeota archaeon]|nr:hypothetical protein [Candidatus Woesearchaeota archaeon]
MEPFTEKKIKQSRRNYNQVRAELTNPLKEDHPERHEKIYYRDYDGKESLTPYSELKTTTGDFIFFLNFSWDCASGTYSYTRELPLDASQRPENCPRDPDIEGLVAPFYFCAIKIKQTVKYTTNPDKITIEGTFETGPDGNLKQIKKLVNTMDDLLDMYFDGKY